MSNNRFKCAVIFGLVVIAIHAIQGQTCPRRVNGIHDMRLHGLTYLMETGVNRRQCGRKCIASGSCQAVNFHKQESLCDLIGTANKASLTPRTGSEYIEKTDLIQEYGDPCAANPCPALKTCVKLSSGVTHCIVTECGGPPAVPNAVVQNSRPEKPVGSSAVYLCNAGYKLSEGSTGKLMCLASGQFAAVDFVCEQVICPNPPNLDYAGHSMTSNVPGATVTYTCITGYTMSNGQTTATSTCGDDGTWSVMSVTCSVPCPNPPSLDNAGYSMTSNVPGATVTYTCADFYVMSTDGGKTNIITCQNDGTWSVISFSCNRLVFV